MDHGHQPIQYRQYISVYTSDPSWTICDSEYILFFDGSHTFQWSPDLEHSYVLYKLQAFLPTYTMMYAMIAHRLPLGVVRPTAEGPYSYVKASQFSILKLLV